MKKYIFIKSVPLFLLLLFFISGCVIFKGEIPVEGDFPEIIYISPENQDQIQDSVNIPLKIPPREGLKVEGYYLTVKNPAKIVVYSMGQARDPENSSKQNAAKTPLVLPAAIIWDGRDANGNWAADGEYIMIAEVWDKNGNSGMSPQVKIVVDNTAPYALLSFPLNIFSPNSDNKQDLLQVIQKQSSVEEKWTGTFRDSREKIVKQYTWTGLADSFTWDGKTNEGLAAEEGSFEYSLEATDLAGNSTSIRIMDIVIDNSVYPVNIFADREYFSPNNDKIFDVLRLQLEAENPDSIVSARVEILDDLSNVQLSVDIQKPLPAFIDFDGKKDNLVLADGLYFARFSASYNNGFASTGLSNNFYLDTTAPTAVLRSEYKTFSPDGDGRKDVVNILQSSSVESVWQGVIQTAQGREIINYSWDTAVTAFSWDGKNSAGVLVPDGEYQYVLASTDQAGNSYKSALAGIMVDTRATPVTIDLAKYAFSPNADGIEDNITFLPKLAVNEGVLSWQLRVENNEAKTVKLFANKGLEPVPEMLSWDGSDEENNITEGLYIASLTVEYEKGNLTLARADNPITVNIAPPEITIGLSTLLFSPDNNGENDTLNINVAVSDPSGVELWYATIYDPAGNVFLQLKSEDFKDGEFLWDGKSESGELVQSASDYKIEVFASDMLGNRTTENLTIPVDILVINDGDKIKISISSIYFKANTADYLSLSPELVAKNQANLDRLADIFKKYPNYNIQLQGHAVREYWQNLKRWEKEEVEVLLPLSTKRAEVIRDALIRRGIKSERMTVFGFGGYQPVVPHSDLVNRWKNRRVEFILVKNN